METSTAAPTADTSSNSINLAPARHRLAAMGRFGLSTKIYLSIAIMLVLLLTMGGVAVLGFVFIGKDFSAYRTTARDTNLAGRLQANILLGRLGEKEFVLSGSGAAIEQVRDRVSQALNTVRSVEEDIQDTDTLERFVTIKGELEKYQSIFEDVTQLQAQRDRQVRDVLDIKGLSISKAFADIASQAYADYDVTTAYTAGMAQARMLTARLNARRFLITSDPAAEELASAEFEALSGLEGELASAVDSDEKRAVIATAFADLGEYRDTFAAIVETIVTRDGMIRDGLDQIGPRIAKEIEAINLTSEDRQAMLAPRVESNILDMEQFSILVMVISLVVGVVAGLALVRSISRPVRLLTRTMNRLADDDLEVEVQGVTRGDEIGAMARAVDVFKQNACRMRELETEQQAAEQRAHEEKTRAMNDLAKGFEDSIGGMVKTLARLVTDVRASSQEVNQVSEDATRTTVTVAGVSEQSSANIQAVSAASDELVASISEISGQMSRAADMARNASADAQRGTAQMTALADTAQRVGDVVTLIQDIAAQTNLLALNATIEAARAGEAGKGFAVVASEVKTLAEQTAKATDEIRQQIEAMQSASQNAVEAIHGVEKSVESLDEMNATVAAAVEEQASTTQEIARNTQEAASGAEKVSSGIAEVSGATDQTGSGARLTLQKCEALKETAEALDKEVLRFVAHVRAG